MVVFWCSSAVNALLHFCRRPRGGTAHLHRRSVATASQFTCDWRKSPVRSVQRPACKLWRHASAAHSSALRKNTLLSCNCVWLVFLSYVKWCCCLLQPRGRGVRSELAKHLEMFHWEATPVQYIDAAVFLALQTLLVSEPFSYVFCILYLDFHVFIFFRSWRANRMTSTQRSTLKLNFGLIWTASRTKCCSAS